MHHCIDLVYTAVWIVLNQNDFFQGCIQEENIDYRGHGIGHWSEVHGVVASPQACAELCVSIKGGLYWTYSYTTKNCYVKSSNSGRLIISNVVSGTRACGLAQLTPLGVAVSQQQDNSPTDHCVDSNPSTFCVVAKAPFPWLALFLGSKARVDRVEIWNRRDCCGHRLRNLEVRVTDSLPSSGILKSYY